MGPFLCFIVEKGCSKLCLLDHAILKSINFQNVSHGKSKKIKCQGRMMWQIESLLQKGIIRHLGVLIL